MKEEEKKISLPQVLQHPENPKAWEGIKGGQVLPENVTCKVEEQACYSPLFFLINFSNLRNRASVTLGFPWILLEDLDLALS